MPNDKQIVLYCSIGTAAIGTLNSVYKHKKLPSGRFIVGSGMAYVFLGFVTEMQPEIGKALSIAMFTTALLGEGGGVLSYLEKRGELDTSKDETMKDAEKRVPKYESMPRLPPPTIPDYVPFNFPLLPPIPNIDPRLR